MKKNIAFIGKTLEERFWLNVLERPEEGCWLFEGLGEDGYGRIYTGASPPEGLPPKKTQKAHRVSWILHNGPISDTALLVLHKCDTPACIRPSHLFLGTNQDNMTDMSMKKRGKNSQRTHCVNGHEFTKANTYLSFVQGKAGNTLEKRHCVQCMRNRTTQKQTCPYGHPYTEENTIIKYRVQRGQNIKRRFCRSCGYK